MSESGKTETSLPNTHDLPIPAVGTSEVMGLVELLKHKGGHADIYKLAQELQLEFGDTLKVIRAAELLGLVNTPGGDVVLERQDGVKLVQAQFGVAEDFKEAVHHWADRKVRAGRALERIDDKLR